MLDARYSILDTGYWILDARCSILDTRYLILDTGCSMLDARCSILDTGYLILDARYWLLVTCYWNLVTGCWILVTGYLLQVAATNQRINFVRAWPLQAGTRHTGRRILQTAFQGFPNHPGTVNYNRLRLLQGRQRPGRYPSGWCRRH
jgi:hypothetical protein